VDHTQRAGRGRKYHLVLIDEAAHDEGYLKDAFPTAITPTTLDYAGAIIEASTPNGASPDNHFWSIAHVAEARPRHLSRADQRQPAFAARGDRRLAGDDAARSGEPGARRPVCEPRGHVDLPARESAEDGELVPDDRPIDTISVGIDSAAGEGGIEHDGAAAVIYGMRQPRIARDGF
jgi:hypothetical protein